MQLDSCLVNRIIGLGEQNYRISLPCGTAFECVQNKEL